MFFTTQGRKIHTSAYPVKETMITREYSLTSLNGKTFIQALYDSLSQAES